MWPLPFASADPPAHKQAFFSVTPNYRVDGTPNRCGRSRLGRVGSIAATPERVKIDFWLSQTAAQKAATKAFSARWAAIDKGCRSLDS